MKKDWEIYRDTGILGGYIPEQAKLRRTEDGEVATVFRDTVTNAIKLIENALKEARQGAFRVRNCHDFEKMCMPNRRRGTPPEKS